MVLVQVIRLQVMTGREEEFYSPDSNSTEKFSQFRAELDVVSERGLSRPVTVTKGSGIVPGNLLYQDWSYPAISTVP